MEDLDQTDLQDNGAVTLDTDKWAMCFPGFMGTDLQLLCCARCCEMIKKGPNEPRHTFDLCKPTMHFICDACYNACFAALPPEQDPGPSATEPDAQDFVHKVADVIATVGAALDKFTVKVTAPKTQGKFEPK